MSIDAGIAAAGQRPAGGERRVRGVGEDREERPATGGEVGGRARPEGAPHAPRRPLQRLQ